MPRTARTRFHTVTPSCPATAVARSIRLRQSLVGVSETNGSIYDVLDAWDLLKDGIDLARYSPGNWDSIGEALEAVSPGSPEPVLGSVHLGLSHGLRVAEGKSPVADIATYAVAHEAVWLPNPLASFFCMEPAEAWALLPESGSDFFGNSPHVEWRPVRLLPVELRRSGILQFLPPVLDRLRELRPLVELGAVRFITWECPVIEDRDGIRKHVRDLAVDREVQRLCQRYPQHQYNLGVRLGAIGLAAKDDFSDGRVKRREQLWIGDKSPMVMGALLNAAVSVRTAASVSPDLRGDRLLYDYILSGGVAEPRPRPLAEKISLPRFGDAVMPDLAAVRKDSELLNELRVIVREAAGATEDQVVPALRDRLDEVASRLREDASLRKSFGAPGVDVTLTTIGTAVASYALGAAGAAVAIGAASGAVAYLARMLRPLFSTERRATAARAEIVTQIRDRID